VEKLLGNIVKQGLRPTGSTCIYTPVVWFCMTRHENGLPGTRCVQVVLVEPGEKVLLGRKLHPGSCPSEFYGGPFGVRSCFGRSVYVAQNPASAQLIRACK